jgi:hypothetical protein
MAEHQPFEAADPVCNLGLGGRHSATDDAGEIFSLRCLHMQLASSLLAKLRFAVMKTEKLLMMLMVLMILMTMKMTMTRMRMRRMEG